MTNPEPIATILPRVLAGLPEIPMTDAEKAAAFDRFRTLWSAYTTALAQPFGATKAEDEAIRQRVDRTFDQLNQLAREAP